MPFHEITLNDGRKVPQIGFGSWKIPKDVCAGQVDQAIDVGFDHIDTAQGTPFPSSLTHIMPTPLIISLPQRRRSRTGFERVWSSSKRVLAHYQMVWSG